MRWLLLTTLALFWGSAFLFTELAVADIPPTALVPARLAVAAIALNAALLATGRRLPRDPGRWLGFVPVAITGSVLPFLLISWGQERLESGVAGMLMAVTPLAAVGIAHFALPGEPLTRRMLGGVALALGGVAVLVGPESLAGVGAADTLPRQAAVLTGAVAYALNTVLARRLPPLDPLVFGAGVTLVALVLALPMALLAEAPSWSAVGPAALGATIWLGLLPTGVATLVHYRLVRSAGAGFASLTNYAVPMIALLTGAAVLGERIDGVDVAGLGLILLGIAAARRPRVVHAAAPGDRAETAGGRAGVRLRAPALRALRVRAVPRLARGGAE